MSSDDAIEAIRARADVDYLLRQVERLEAENKRLRDELDEAWRRAYWGVD